VVYPRKKVLVIDDEHTSVDLLVAVLQFLGHQTEATSSGREALQKIAHHDYDLIICDVKMPEVDGRQVYQFVKEQHPHMVKRLIFTSGDTVSEKSRKFLDKTGCQFLSKPFLLDEFKQAINQASMHGAA
jgi:CheY-like chemotaxis protein